ncbi:very-long-chain (3R)-3-hydroxyacyl-CoA dehydratase Phs1p [[Candida] railenensis]|uniref:Very-long-chain (3R)-3-hydroxyacyl-CoA dehydratase n=1 Tax=[Candida] railenensis TaxID=45579 RepID=A0A9P0W0U3_9ASCO|nr:very-long-chain (3R)-3-hydroxyacyl-CoA dehydratase Phs1p [[Candida] railenensis]
MKRISNLYLKVYNGVSIILWLLVLYGVLLGENSWFSQSPRSLYRAKSTSEVYPHKFLNITEWFNAILEIVHSLVGLVPSPLPTLLLQLTARLLITQGISYKLPQSAGNYSWGYATLSFVWSVSDLIKYAFYFAKLFSRKGQGVPAGLTWLRYTAFIVLYPLGLVGESHTVYLSLDAAQGSHYYWFLIFALASYIPGFFLLYGYMLKQRKKVLSKETVRASKAQ